MLVVEGCRTPQKLTAGWSPCARQMPGLLRIGRPAGPARAHKTYIRAAQRVEVLLIFLNQQHMQCLTCMVRQAFGHVMHAHTHSLDMQLSQTSQTCLACSARAEMS